MMQFLVSLLGRVGCRLEKAAGSGRLVGSDFCASVFLFLFRFCGLQGLFRALGGVLER